MAIYIILIEGENNGENGIGLIRGSEGKRHIKKSEQKRPTGR